MTLAALPRFGGRVYRALRHRLAGNPLARTAWTVARDVPLLAIDPAVGIALVRADLGRPNDVDTLSLLERGLRRRRSASAVRRYAELLMLAGEPTRAVAEWRWLAERGDRSAVAHVRRIEGRLTETDTTWLPVVHGARERLAPVSRRRVLHILKSAPPERWSGFTIRTLQNLRAQRAAGLEPVVVTQIGWPRDAGTADVPARRDFEGFEFHHLDRGASYRPRSLPADIALQDNADDMAQIVRDVRPALLHVHSGYRGGELALVALALRERFGIPVVYEVRGLFETTWTSDPRIAERAEMYERRLAQETRILREVDGVFAISEALRDEIASRGIPRSKVALLPNGIDPDALVEAPRDVQLRASLGLDGRRVVGYVGNLDHWREGLDVLVAAVARLNRRGRHDIAALIVGDGVRRSSIEAAARRERIAHAVVFTGRVPHAEISRYYAQLDVFTNPRVDERAARLITPLKPYEAMALGIPVLVSDLPALREIVDPPKRGNVVAPGDPVALADGIERLLDDEARRAELANTARQWVRSERTWAANGPRARVAYERILGALDEVAPSTPRRS